MSAKEMFEKLGYTEYEETYKYIYYKESLGKIVIFNKETRLVQLHIEDSYGCRIGYNLLSISLLQAINKQIEELGWNNE